MNQTNLFPKDFEASKKLHEFLKKNFYSILKKTRDQSVQYNIIDYEDTLNSSEDYKGVDFIFKVVPANDPSHPPITFTMDEKGALDFKFNNWSLSTFAFELGYLKVNPITNNKEYREGWLTNPDKITDYYVLVWPHAIEDENSYYFDVAELMIISRKNVISILEEELLKNPDYNRDTLIDQLRQESQEIVQENKCQEYIYQKYKYKHDDDYQRQYNKHRYVKWINEDKKIKFIHSLHKPEAPLNIIINKELLFNKTKCVFWINSTSILRKLDYDRVSHNFDYINRTLENYIMQLSIPSTSIILAI